MLAAVLEDAGVVGATSYYDTAPESLVSRDGHATLVIVSLAGTHSEKFRTILRMEPLPREVEAPI